MIAVSGTETRKRVNLVVMRNLMHKNLLQLIVNCLFVNQNSKVTQILSLLQMITLYNI